MIGLDTNILVRFLVNDDIKQASQVKKYFVNCEKKGTPLFISNIVVLELIYVLESVYDYCRDDILNALKEMLSIPLFYFENAEAVSDFLVLAEEEKVALTDLFIGVVAKKAGCSTTVTFDKKAAKTNLFSLLDNT